jgi:hypothetical protein
MFLDSLLSRGYVALAQGTAEPYHTSLIQAKQIYERYQKDRVDDAQGRRALPPFVQIRAGSLSAFVLNSRFDMVGRSRVWIYEDEIVRKWAYDNIEEGLRAECEAEGFAFDRAFPEPPGMDKFRRDHPKLVRPEDEAERLRKEAREKLELQEE